MTDEEVGKRLIRVAAAIESLRSDLKILKSEQDEIRDSLLVLIENHKTLFEVFPYMRADIDSIVKHLQTMLELYEEMKTGISDEMYR